MATIDIITLRSVFTTQALTTMGACPEWDRKVAAYLRAEALQHADCDYGAYAEVENDVGLEEIRLADTHGAGWKNNPDLASTKQALQERGAAASERWQAEFADPHDSAARDLAVTPAPTLAAALFKQLMIEREDLGNDNRMPRDAMEIVAEDMARLAQSAA